MVVYLLVAGIIIIALLMVIVRQQRDINHWQELNQLCQKKANQYRDLSYEMFGIANDVIKLSLEDVKRQQSEIDSQIAELDSHVLDSIKIDKHGPN